MAQPVAKDVHDLRLSPQQTDRARRLAEGKGQSFGGVLSEACEIGLAEMEIRHYEADNKRLLNRKLRARDGRMAEAIALLESADTSEVDRTAALATLKSCISD